MAAGRNITIRPPKSKVNSFSMKLLGINLGNLGRLLAPSLADLSRRYNRRVKEETIKQQEQQRLEKHQIIEQTLVEITNVSGSIATNRDEDGNIILYEDSSNPLENVERHDQFISVELFDDEFDIDAAVDAVDFSIVELKSVDKMDLLSNFLRTFRNVLPDIPDGDLQFILRRGVEEQGGELIDPVEFDRLTEGKFSTIIQRLIDLQDKSDTDQSDINRLEFQVDSLEGSLEEQMNSLTTQLEAMGDLVLETSTNDGGLSLPLLINEVVEELRRKSLIAGEIDIPEQGELSTISVKARRILENQTLGEELESDISVRSLLVDVTFLTELGEATTMRMRMPFEVKVPILTNIHGVTEIVTGVKFRLVDTGAFKGWFKNNLKVTSARDYVTGILEPNSNFVLAAAMERNDEPNSGIKDIQSDDVVGGQPVTDDKGGKGSRRRGGGGRGGDGDSDGGEFLTADEEAGRRSRDESNEGGGGVGRPRRGGSNDGPLPMAGDDGGGVSRTRPQVLTLPEPVRDSVPVLPVVTPPVTPLKPLFKYAGGAGRVKGRPMGDPDVPKRPLEDNEIGIEEIVPAKETISSRPGGIIDIRSQIPVAPVTPVVDVTPPVRNPVIIVPPLPKIRPTVPILSRFVSVPSRPSIRSPGSPIRPPAVLRFGRFGRRVGGGSGGRG